MPEDNTRIKSGLTRKNTLILAYDKSESRGCQQLAAFKVKPAHNMKSGQTINNNTKRLKVYFQYIKRNVFSISKYLAL